MTATRKLKSRKCKAAGCDNEFIPFSSLESWCSPACGYALSQEKLARKARSEALKTKRERIAAKKAFQAKDKPYQIKLTQKAFNAFVRERDHGEPCISCGITYGKMNAGHYKSVGSSPELRFEPLNCHLQCEQCNSSKSGNVVPYRVNLIKKIGIEAVEWLEGPHGPKKYTCDDLIEMRAVMVATTKGMARDRDQQRRLMRNDG